jgi:tetratricopeptide (TPR) repeat protein
MTLYRRQDISSPWHWRKNCPNWPAEHFEELQSYSRPLNLCEHCRQMEVTESQIIIKLENVVASDTNCRFFILYESSSEQSLVDNVKHKLKQIYSNAPVFFINYSQLEFGFPDNKLDAALLSCKYFIVVISTANIDANRIFQLAQRAIRYKKRIIPFRNNLMQPFSTSGAPTFNQYSFSDFNLLSKKIIDEIKGVDALEVKISSIDEDDSEHTRRGILFYYLDKINESLSEFNRAVQISPLNAQAWLNYGLILYLLEQHQEALTAFEKSLDLAPNSPTGWSYKGAVLYRLNQIDQASKAFDNALRLSPNEYFAWLTKGQIAQEEGDYNEALTAYNNAIELNPKDTETWTARSIMTDNLNQIKDSLKRNDNRGIEINPSDTLASLNEAISLSQAGKLNKALNIFNKVIKENPNAYVAWYNKGIIWDGLGDEEEALRCYDKANELDKKYPRPETDQESNAE